MSNEFIQNEKRRLEQQIELSAGKIFVLVYLSPRPCAESSYQLYRGQGLLGRAAIVACKSVCRHKKSTVALTRVAD